MIEYIKHTDGPAPGGPYSPGVKAGNFLYVSGQGPFDPEGNLVNDTFEDQVRETFKNLERVAKAAGTSLQNTVKVNAYLSTLNYFQRFNAVMEEFFPDARPARTTVPVDLHGFDIEIDVVIYIPEGQ